MLNPSLVFLLFLSIVLTGSCADQESQGDDGLLYPIKEITIPCGFSAWHFRSTSFDTTSYLLLSDLITEKRSVVYDLESNRIEHEFDLRTVIDTFGTIDKVDLLSKDTLVVLNLYSNIVSLVDTSGRILKAIDLNNHLTISHEYNLSGGWQALSCVKDQIVLRGYYSDTKEFEGLSYSEHNQKCYDAKYLFEVNGLLDSVSIRSGADGVYTRFADGNQVLLEGGRYFTTETSYFISPIFVDTMYEYAKSNMQLKKCHKITSQYTEIGYTPRTIEEEMENPDGSNQLGRTKGCVWFAGYHPWKRLILVTVNHEIPLDASDGKMKRPWSLLIYNDKMELISEEKMDKELYVPYVLMTKEGVLVPNFPEHEDEEDAFTKTTFQLFGINEI